MPAFEDDDFSRDDRPYRARNQGRDDDSFGVDDDDVDDRDLVPDEMTTVRCTRCKKLIFEDSVTCPYCKSIQLADHASKPRWFFFTVILCIFLLLSGVVTALLHFMGLFQW